MFESHRPEIDEPRAIWMAYLAGSLTFGIIVFSVIFVVGFFMYLDSGNTTNSIEYEILDDTVNALVTDKDPLGSLIGVSTAGGIAAGVGLFLKHLAEFFFLKK